jgi:Domain of unknown function (DUF4169)
MASMAEIVNLNRARKQKSRVDKAKVAEVNRIKYGRTKAEKLLEKFEQQKADENLDGHKRDPK